MIRPGIALPEAAPSDFRRPRDPPAPDQGPLASCAEQEDHRGVPRQRRQGRRHVRRRADAPAHHDRCGGSSAKMLVPAREDARPCARRPASASTRR